MIRMATVAALVLVAGPAVADKVTGNDLARACREVIEIVEKRDGSSYEAGFCLGYIEGAIVTYRLGPVFEKMPRYCMPAEVTLGQIARIIIKHTERLPDLLHENASVWVNATLVRTFPCGNPS